MKRQLILGHIGTLLLGGLIYTLFRTSSLLMFEWYNRIGLLNPIKKLRESITLIANDIPHWLLYSLPDGLWIFSYISLMLFVWKNSISFENIVWILIIPILAIGSELGQLLGFISGTFDFADLVFYFLGTIIPFLFYHKSIKY